MSFAFEERYSLVSSEVLLPDRVCRTREEHPFPENSFVTSNFLAQRLLLLPSFKVNPGQAQVFRGKFSLQREILVAGSGSDKTTVFSVITLSGSGLLPFNSSLGQSFVSALGNVLGTPQSPTMHSSSSSISPSASD
jgi:hypothetical protein